MNTITELNSIKSPKQGTKQARLVDMLGRKKGITLTKASEAFGWQKHTTSAVITGLRKRGYNIVRVDNGDKPSAYVIAETA